MVPLRSLSLHVLWSPRVINLPLSLLFKLYFLTCRKFRADACRNMVQSSQHLKYTMEGKINPFATREYNHFKTFSLKISTIRQWLKREGISPSPTKPWHPCNMYMSVMVIPTIEVTVLNVSCPCNYLFLNPTVDFLLCLLYLSPTTSSVIISPSFLTLRRFLWSSGTYCSS